MSAERRRPDRLVVVMGTGTGVVAATLALRYRMVVATDVVPRLAGAARLTAALNRFPPGHRVEACVADVARGLTPGAFDFVAANTPWVPSGAAGQQPRIFADGGPTGFELPRRFVVEGAGLLAPGGVAVMLAADVSFSDGAAPLRRLCADLAATGHFADLLPTPYGRPVAGTEAPVLVRLPGVVGACHVAVVIARRPLRPGLMAAVDGLRHRWRVQGSPPSSCANASESSGSASGP